MENSDISCCIIIPSHVSSTKNLFFFDKCLDSLTKQTNVIPIYLSVSFDSVDSVDNKNLKRQLNDLIEKYKLVNVIMRETKKSQFSHIQKTFNEIKHKFDWYLFCDDDDTYNLNRVEVFLFTIKQIIIQLKNQNKLCAGIYEEINRHSHLTNRMEYWQYAINKNVLEQFFDRLQKYENKSPNGLMGSLIDHKFCDILFVEFLRRLDNSHMFFIIQGTLYNYNKNNNGVTGQIQMAKQEMQKNKGTGIDDVNLYIKLLNEYIDKNLSYVHDNIFFLTIAGINFDDALKRSFSINLHEYLKYIDSDKIKKLKNYHNSITLACQQIYQQNNKN